MSSRDIECKGCFGYHTDIENLKCIMPHKIKNYKCPCLICIVKSMCKATKPCNSFKIYWRLLYGEDGLLNKEG